MRILITDDGSGFRWAIGNIVKALTKHNDRFSSYLPKLIREMQACISTVVKEFNKGIDVWHCQYWNSGNQIMEMYPPARKIPSILTHHNHNHIHSAKWDNYNVVVSDTAWGKNELMLEHPNVHWIPLGVDLDRYSYIQAYSTVGESVGESRGSGGGVGEYLNIGYVGRIVPWKNVHTICKVAKELGYKVFGSGFIDKTDFYKKEVEKYVKDGTLEFNGGVGLGSANTEILKDRLYEKMTVFVMYSTGERETGTLPLFEAMARGVPVMATRQGSARFLVEDGKNGILFEDEADFKTKLKALMEDEKLRLSIRSKAWDKIRGYSEEEMARQYGKLYIDTYSRFKQ